MQGTFWAQASQVLGHPARLWILPIKRRQHMPISRYIPGKVEVNGSKKKKKKKEIMLCARFKNKFFFFLSFLDGARHSTVCVRGQEHPRGHGSRRSGLLLVCASVQLGEIRQRPVSFREPLTSFSGQSTHFLRRAASEQPQLKLPRSVQRWCSMYSGVNTSLDSLCICDVLCCATSEAIKNKQMS